MKKAIVFVSALFLIASMAFAQTPQTPAKSTSTTTTTTKSTTSTSTEKKDSKGSCDMKSDKSCPASKSCCAHDKAGTTEKKAETPAKK